MVFITLRSAGARGPGELGLAQLSKRKLEPSRLQSCTFPFRAEGAIRRRTAEYGLEKLRSFADTVVVIPMTNSVNWSRVCPDAAFKWRDDVLMRAIKGITEVITSPAW